MKGLLHRLAERAAGTATAIRSDARLPFARVAPAFGDSDTTDAGPRLGAAIEPAVVPQAPVAARVETPVPAAARGSTQASQATARAAPLGPAAPPRGQTTAPAALDAPAVRVAVEAAPTPPRRAEGAAANAMMKSIEDRRVDATVQEQRLPLHAAGTPDPAPPPRSAETARRRPGPAPLMPAVAPAPLPSGAAVAAAVLRNSDGRAAVALSAADEPNEVHIHIGRIDVTATNEPAPRRRPAAATAPVSLGTYLARRSQS